MKKLVLGLITITLSFSVFSAELMSKVEFEKVKQNYVKVGDIYFLTSANTSNKISGPAIVYKKK